MGKTVDEASEWEKPWPFKRGLGISRGKEKLRLLIGKKFGVFSERHPSLTSKRDRGRGDRFSRNS